LDFSRVPFPAAMITMANALEDVIFMPLIPSFYGCHPALTLFKF